MTWDAEVIALRAGGSDAPGNRPYIDIGAPGAHGRILRVGLALRALDPPALAKTVIMIRNYKRLRRGRMEFGDAPARVITKIISGGQTGVDRAALDADAACGIAGGGFCPKGRRAEDGPIPPHYPLTELASADYPTRTRRNVHAADATLVLTRGRLRGGTLYTVQVARHARNRCSSSISRRNRGSRPYARGGTNTACMCSMSPVRARPGHRAYTATPNDFCFGCGCRAPARRVPADAHALRLEVAHLHADPVKRARAVVHTSTDQRVALIEQHVAGVG